MLNGVGIAQGATPTDIRLILHAVHISSEGNGDHRAAGQPDEASSAALGPTPTVNYTEAPVRPGKGFGKR